MHSALYLATASSPPLPVSQSSCKKPKEKDSYLRTFDVFNNLIEENETNILVDRQMRQDAKDLQVAQVNPAINVILRRKQPQLDLITFFHGACIAPVASTWIKAIKNGQFATWPGLTDNLVNKYLRTRVYTAKGHLNQERKFLQSTKQHQKDYAARHQELKYKLAQLQKQVQSDKSLTNV